MGGILNNSKLIVLWRWEYLMINIIKKINLLTLFMHTILNDNINPFLAKKCLEECPHAFSSCLYGDPVHMYDVYSASSHQ